MNNDELIADGLSAFSSLRRSNNRGFESWLRVGLGLQAGQNKLMTALEFNNLDNHLGKKAHSAWLRASGFNQVPAQARRALAQIVSPGNLPRIRAWHAGLSESQKFRINHPVSIWRSWQASIGQKIRTQPVLVSMRLDGNGAIIRKIMADDGDVAAGEYIQLATMLVKFVAAKEQTTETEVLSRLNDAVGELVNAE